MYLYHESEFQKIFNSIEKSQNIVIISHRSPDGDAIGANLALATALRDEMNKNVVSACIDEVPANYDFVEGVENFVTEFDPQDFDLIISVDCATEKLVKFQEKIPHLFDGKTPFINIDHHQDNTKFGDINLVANEAATAIIIYHFLNFARLKITIDIATYLIIGIYFDTGGLMHSNTTPSVYRIVADLVSKGGDFQTASKYMFHRIPFKRLKLWGKVLTRTQMNVEGVVSTAILPEDFHETGTTSDDTAGLVDYLNMVKGAKYCMLLNENEQKGIVKGSLRTLHEDVDVSKIAHKFGGGGHHKASGFAVDGKLRPEVVWKVVADS